MNKFNMCKNYITKLFDMPVPKGALYGKDRFGVWVCIHKELYTKYKKPTLELYRWNNEETGWILIIEQSDTTKYIADCATRFDLWHVPIEYPKFTGIHKVSANMDKTVTRSKCNSFKRVVRTYENRHNSEQISLDTWEKVISHVR